MTVTNLSTSLTLNDFDTYVGYPGITLPIAAVGGSRVRPVPYPFSHLVFSKSPVAGYQVQLPVHPADFSKQVPWGTFAPSTEWNQVVQSGAVSVSFANETTRRDTEELFTAAV